MPTAARGLMDIGLLEQPRGLPVWFSWKMRATRFVKRIGHKKFSGQVSLRAAKKIAAAALVLGLLLQGGGLAILYTAASFNDIESSSANIFQVSSLDFTITSNTDDWFEAEDAHSMQPGNETAREMALKNEGLMPAQYDATVEQTGGDEDFFNALEVLARHNGTTTFDGLLKDFIHHEPALAPGGQDTWLFRVFLPFSPDHLNQNADFRIKFSAWDENLPVPAGFTDEEELPGLIESWGLRINEVYQASSTAEFVELYNPTNEAIDTGGWKIRDNTATDTLPSALVPAGGFGVILTASSTVTGIHPAAVKIILNNSTIGNGLAAGGDRLVLMATMRSMKGSLAKTTAPMPPRPKSRATL